MQVRYLKALISTAIVVLCLGFFMILMQFKAPIFIEEIIKEIDQVSIYSWDDDKVATYRAQILDEMEVVSQRISMQEGYYALGFLEALADDFEKSNEYYFKALSIGETRCLSICGKIYKELSYNFLALGDEITAKYYFELAEKKAAKYHNKGLRSSLYRRFSQGVMEYTEYTYAIIPLLELVIDENINDYDYLEAHRLLANIYLLGGHYEKSISYLLDAYKLSVWHDYDQMQLEIKIKLGEAYFLNGEYEQALLILKECVSPLRAQDFLSYIPQLVESYRIVEGRDEAIKFLDDYVGRLLSTEQGWIQFWYAYIRVDLALKEGNIEEVNQFIKQLNEVYDTSPELQDSLLYLWKDKVELDYLMTTGIRNEDVVKAYEALYEEIKDSYIYVTAKVNLLEDVVNQSIKISNYELGYHYLDERMSNFKSHEDNVKSLNINEIYEGTLNKLKQDKVKKIIIISGFGFFLLGGIGAIGYIIWKKHSQIQILSKEIKAKQDVDTLTNTLTKETLYECLEIHMGTDDILNFMVVNINDFKRYNEVYGYLAGDKVLQTVAEMIKSIFPEAYVARHAGHHFIIVSDNEESTCLLKLEYMFELMYEKHIPNSSNLMDQRVTISAGLSNGKILTRLQIDQHINNATYKLELSKKHGVNKVTL